MAYEPLHHKYRPQTFAELVGQEAIATTLTHALRQQKIAPAYLFTGARGTGKTSSARILAKSLNCLKTAVPTETPCGVCEVCQSIARGSALDVIEIDAASNTGVDHIRELIERAQFAPVQCRYKVYVIDECHMLSTAAFNALLKTLEEPPDRVVFVLATTDPQRVLPTIISRCQRFDFRRIELTAMVQHLTQIAVAEGIQIVPEAVQLVGQIAQGGLRDAESMLDQLSLLEQEITPERVWDLVGAVPERDLLALVQAIAQNQPTPVIDGVRHLMDRGREPLIVLQNLASFYRDLLIAKTTPDRNDLVAITPPTWAEMTRFVQNLDLSALLSSQQHLRSSELQIKNTTQPRLWLEVTLLGLLPSTLAAPSRQPFSSNPSPSGAGQVLSHPVPSHPVPSNPVPSSPAANSPVASPPPVPVAAEYSPEPSTRTEEAPLPSLSPVTSPSPRPANLEQIWQEMLAVLQPPGTQALFRQQGRLLALDQVSATIGITSQPLFKMAQLRVSNLEAAFTQLVQHPVKVSLEVVPTLPDASPPSPPPVTSSSHPPSPSPIRSVVKESATPKPAARSAVPTNNLSANNLSANNLSANKPSAHPTPAHPVSAENPELPQPWQGEDEVSRAAKSLAQMFNGQIVSYDSSGTEPARGDTGTGQASDGIGEGDPDGDVPF